MVDTNTPSSRSTAASGQRSKQRSSAISRVSRAGGNLIASMLRRADIESIDLSNATAAQLNIDEIAIGPSSVEQLTIGDIHTLVNTGQVSLDDVTTRLKLVIHVDWRVNLLFSSPSDSFRLGSFEFDFDVGNIDIPELENLDIDIPTATATDAVATVQSITDLSFNGGRVDDIHVMDIRLPTSGYAMQGIAFESLELSHIGVPDAGVGTLTIGSVSPNDQLTLPLAEIRDIGVADVQVPAVTSRQSVSVSDIRASAQRITLVDIGLLRVRIIVEPILEMTIGGMTMDDIEAVSTISSVKLENIRFPLSIKGISMTDINLQQLRAQQISL